MQAYLPEKIGNPELFSGRKKELDLFQRWIDASQKDFPEAAPCCRAVRREKQRLCSGCII